MEDTDTIKLLKECDAGTKMAVSSIDEVLDKVQSTDMKKLLTDSRTKHEILGNELHGILVSNGSDEKDPSPIAKGMSWMNTKMKVAIDHSDSTIADLITDGCDMGVKSLNKYLNQYQAADSQSKSICNELVKIEEQLCRDLRGFL